jgi:hypothetical protein
VGLLVLLALLAPVRAQTPSLAGTWLAILDLNGIVFPHVEELRIGKDGSVTTSIYASRDLADCAAKPSAQSGPCATGRPNAKGRLVMDNATKTLSVADLDIADDAMAGIGVADDERVAREVFWFGPGGPWTFTADGTALVMRRNAKLIVPNAEEQGPKAVSIEKRFFPVDDTFAADLISLTGAADFSVIKMVCLMPFVTGNAPSAGAFRATMRDIATVARKQQDLLAAAQTNPSPEIVEALRVSVATLGPGSTPSAETIAATAKGLGVTPALVDRFATELVLRRQQEPVDALLFTAMKTHAAEIRACHKQFFE